MIKQDGREWRQGWRYNQYALGQGESFNQERATYRAYRAGSSSGWLLTEQDGESRTRRRDQPLATRSGSRIIIVQDQEQDDRTNRKQVSRRLAKSTD